ncbi:MAG TPA: YqgE/AlgH family protein [Planctomycetota bacterium]|nr:YqgE/AlgH family protein [Planctomycetota bacterium]
MPKPPIEPRPGSLLLAAPHLSDPNFRRTAVLLCDHTGKGAFGFVLNRPAGRSLEDVLPVPNHFPERNDPVYLGGPVGLDSMTVFHQESDLTGSREVLPGVFIGGEVEELARVVALRKTPPSDLRFLIGYSGWGEGQLLNEVRENAWVVCPCRPQWVFDPDPETLWQRALRTIGAFLRHFPDEPQAN